MIQEYQIHRNSLAWLLAAQVAVIAPHVGRLPFWVLLVCAACGFWRVLVYNGKAGYPGRWIKSALVVAGTAGVPIGYRTLLGLEPAVALLIVAFFLKLLEMQRKRDAYVVVFLAYFVSITEFLFDQTIPMTLYMLGVITMITAGLHGLNQTQGHVKPLKTIVKSGTLLLQAVPLMLVLFVLFPRIEPLWTVPIQSPVGKTGVSDRMTPGDIAELTQSDALAFRATFEGQPPPASQLYWRGIVLSEFRGKTWTQWGDGIYGRNDIYFPSETPADWDEHIERVGEPLNYSVIMEPTNQNWIFSLPSMMSRTQDIGLVRDHRLYAVRPVQSRYRYDVSSYLQYTNERSISPWWQSRLTKLPEQGNPRARIFADEQRDLVDTDAEFVNLILKKFYQENYVYTLRPDLLGDDSVDEFLFESRRGFCEHYAGSFVFLMRAAGIPARVVVGYQGGEYNPRGNYVAVYQFDAHAWAEVWLPGEGWKRVDPTSAVAPDRIERGLEAAMEGEESFLADSAFSWMKYRQNLWITELRLQLSALGHYWDTWVIGYNPTTQMKFLGRFFEDLDLKKLGMLMLSAFFGLLGVVALFLLMKRGSRKLPPVDEAYLRFCHLLAKQGIERRTGEAPMDYARRIVKHRPDLESSVQEVTELYIQLSYSGEESDPSRLKKAVRGFQVKALTANV